MGLEFAWGGGTGTTHNYPGSGINTQAANAIDTSPNYYLWGTCTYSGLPRWGDYLTVRTYQADPTRWVAAGYAMKDGNCGVTGAYSEPHNVLFSWRQRIPGRASRWPGGAPPRPGPGPRPSRNRPAPGSRSRMKRSVRTALAVPALAAAVLSAVGCGDSRASGSPGASDSGIEGRTMVDGGCPMVREHSPCPDRPLSARPTVTTRRPRTDGHQDHQRHRRPLPYPAAAGHLHPSPRQPHRRRHADRPTGGRHRHQRALHHDRRLIRLGHPLRPSFRGGNRTTVGHVAVTAGRLREWS